MTDLASLPRWAPPGADSALDALGLRCPLPVIRLEAALRTVPPGHAVAVRADDPIAAVDIPHAARTGGHACIRIEGEPCVFVVTRGDEGSASGAEGV